MSNLSNKFSQAAIIAFLLILFSFFIATDSYAGIEKYMAMDLEDILNMNVTSASRRDQKLSEVSNAITVLTREDIERSGAKNLQDLFYRVPGMQVRRVDGVQYGVAIRGYSDTWTNDLLVLIDGVTCFSPTLNTVFWETLPVSLNEIERIEIIRGAGGVLYHSNGVNGVINIITKDCDAKDNYVSVKAGTKEFFKSGFGLGQELNSQTKMRLYYEYDGDDGFDQQGNLSGQQDDHKRHNLGLRIEQKIDADSKILATLKYNTMNMYNNGLWETLGHRDRAQKIIVGGLDYSREISEEYNFSINLGVFNHDLCFYQTSDVDVTVIDLRTQHNVTLDNHLVSFGVEGYYNELGDPSKFRDDYRNDQLILSAFAQDEYRIADKWILTPGIRMDKNSTANNERLLFSPRVSIMYLFSDKHNLRLVASKLYRSPSISEKDSVSNLSGITYTGNYDIIPEKVYTYELGYRGLFLENKFMFDADLFYMIKKNYAKTTFPVTNPAWFSGTYVNICDLKSYGLEMEAEYNFTKNILLYSDFTRIIYCRGQAINDDSKYFADLVIAGVSDNIVGAGVRYTKDRLKCDLYVNYSKGYTKYAIPVQQGIYGTQDVHYKSWFNTSLRIAYGFDLLWLPHTESELELVFNDLGHDHVERHNYYIEPELYAGVKVKF